MQAAGAGVIADVQGRRRLEEDLIGQLDGLLRDEAPGLEIGEERRQVRLRYGRKRSWSGRVDHPFEGCAQPFWTTPNDQRSMVRCPRPEVDPRSFLGKIDPRSTVQVKKRREVRNRKAMK